MAKVKSTDTKPEMLLRKFLFSQNFRYRKNFKNLPGKPDIVLSKYKTVIFVNGCFWHGHGNCKASTLPKSNIAYWANKITGNINRDKLKKKELKKLGWSVIVVWECQVKEILTVGSFQQKKLLHKIKNRVISTNKDI